MLLLLVPVTGGCASKSEKEVAASDEEDKEEKEDADKEEKQKKKKKKKKDDGEDEVDITQEDAGPEGTTEVDMSSEISRMQMEFLYEYKLAQEYKYTDDELMQLGIYSGLEDFGWPESAVFDEIRYVFYDIDSNGTDEMIITYLDKITDIYGFDGEKVKRAFSVSADSEVVLFSNGMLMINVPFAEQGPITTWYEFNSDIGNYFPAFEAYYHDGSENEFYTYCYDESVADEIVESYRNYGTIPVWAYEWGDVITEKEYNDMCPDVPAVELGEGARLTDLRIPADFEGVDFPNSRTASSKASVVCDVELDDKAQYEANIFISNFAEQHHNGNEYYCLSADSEVNDLVHFAYQYYNFNDFDQLEGSYLEQVSLDKVNKVLDRFFGIKLTKEQAAEFYSEYYPDREYYEDGMFHIVSGDGDFMYPDMAIVTGLYELADGTYMMCFTAYNPDTDEDFEDIELYHITPSEAMNNGKLQWKGHGVAYVKPYKYQGRDTYQLISLEAYSNEPQ